MKKGTFLKRVTQLSLALAVMAIIGPIVLSKLNFYPESHAAVEAIAGGSPVSYASAVAKAAPAVVSIQTTKEIPKEMHPLWQDPFFRHFFGDIPGGEGPGNEGGGPDEQVQYGLGSGVIVDKRGYVLTNNHVIKDTNSVVVKLPDGRTSTAKVVGTDSSTDLAVLKIDLKNLPTIAFGNSSALQVGDVVLAIGNPFGLDRTVTMGIVSAMGAVSTRSNEQIHFAGMLDNLIQTDAAINPGNSGGALIDAYGNLIGINMAIISRSGGSQGIGFAIPMDTAKNVMSQLIETGHIIRGWLGAHLSPLNDEMRKYLEFKEKDGVYVAATIRSSPAQKAGILPGDVLMKIDGKSLSGIQNAIQMVGQLKPGTAYPVEVFRKGEFITFSVMIAQRPENT